MIRNFAGNLYEAFSGTFCARPKLKKMEELFERGLPEQMRKALEFLIAGSMDQVTESVVKNAEARRATIAARGDEEVSIWYSPKPGSSGTNSSIEARPQPGKELRFSMERIAKTGKDRKWGTVLYLIGREFELTRGIELGACAGISAMYMSAVPGVSKFITVEGSSALSTLARESLICQRNAEVVNSTFDEAIDSVLPGLDQRLNMAFIDGHHEKTATIHYFNRLMPFLEPGAVVIFDDIFWSKDMLEAWFCLRTRPEFSHTMDLGALGVCILRNESGDTGREPISWNLQPIVGRCRPGKPRGWNE